MSFKRMALAGAALAALGSLGLATPAAAAPAGNGTAAGQEALPPSCVTALESTGFFYDTVYVDNNCRENYRVKVIVAFGFDSPCVNVLGGGGSFFHEYDSTGRFDGLVRC